MPSDQLNRGTKRIPKE